MSPRTRNNYPSVSEILNKMQDTKHLERWKKKLALESLTEEEKKLPEKEKAKIIKVRGEEKSNKIKQDAAHRGTKIHNTIEENTLNPKNKTKLEKEQLDIFTNTYIKPMVFGDRTLIETPVIWEKDDIGFGGKFDYYANIHKPLKQYNSNEKIILDKVLIDWKNPLNVKYAEGFSRETGKYFPLTKYFLQTAAYVGALNQMLEDKVKYKANQTLVVLNPQKSRKTVYFYYCDSYKTCFYWEKFKELLYCFFSNTPFDWEKLNKEIEQKDVIPTRLIL